LITRLHTLDWLHLDLEGLDAQIIMKMYELPNFIIYEHNNLLENEKNELETFLKDKGYQVFCESVSCSATNYHRL